MPIVTANGIQTTYAETGEGEPLILLHGGNGDHHSSDFFRPLLGEGIRVIAYDQRDSPGAPYSGGPYTHRDLAEDCAAFIDALGLKRAHLMGTSFGGTVAMMTAIHYPEHVQGLILSATTPARTMTEPVLEPIMAEVDAAKRQEMMLEILLNPEDTTPELVTQVTDLLVDRPPEIYKRRTASVANHDCRGDLNRIQAPTLVLHGENDPVVTIGTARWMAGHIKGAELQVIPKARHGFTIQYPYRVAEIVRDFVLRHPSTKSGEAIALKT